MFSFHKIFKIASSLFLHKVCRAHSLALHIAVSLGFKCSSMWIYPPLINASLKLDNYFNIFHKFCPRFVALNVLRHQRSGFIAFYVSAGGGHKDAYTLLRNFSGINLHMK